MSTWIVNQEPTDQQQNNFLLLLDECADQVEMKYHNLCYMSMKLRLLRVKNEQVTVGQ